MEVEALISKGGPIAIILLALSIYGLAILLLKLYHFLTRGVLFSSANFVSLTIEQIERGQVELASTKLLKKRRNPIAAVMAKSIQLCDTTSSIDENSAAKEELESEGRAQLEHLTSYIRGLDAVAHLSPLLGLLGTVLGMIQAFMQLEAAGVQVDVALLAGGIWEALVTTAFGLAVAIPALAAVNWLEGIVERVRQDMGDAVTRTLSAMRRAG
ncbi:MAG: MotA/TolQ/ExbB proton channel family protein [Gammaproteobacteria bacterium]|jgi:biopolymer transport protein ExbB|nr:MotA/TolQ/ExbB proton channel family protein [Gammaproteobacteria bacterium]MBT3489263.1 MotA/TolQ/ExbB proton channel family protein [Gammaproteobacteria bacterium]MBT3717801.1 MotA/TolQ/ExbB proton channel family protein [Gammaproteobacteria bacterium]MBT3843611.1 MotA/TolQ/ExbB proton channel family protein [Gammaproteobacteria bacterium]MBT3894047.1 MotA/TolQ/ExbB proton channel family protein [Gammaproteobacteria bacterium]